MRICVTAMDAGAAHQLLPIVGALTRSEGISVQVFSCAAAADVFVRADVKFETFKALPQDLTNPTASEIEILWRSGRELLSTVRPNVVLVGLSYYGCGPDEALMAAAHEVPGKLPTVLLLDDRGPIRSLDNLDPDYVLAVSKEIESWARTNTTSNVHLLGSPHRHALADQPVVEMRHKLRSELNLLDEERLVVLIAQSDRLGGHHDNCRLFLEYLASRNKEKLRLLVRLHPADPESGLKCCAVAKALGLRPECDQGRWKVNEVLAASDAVVSCVSTALIDYLWLVGRDPSGRSKPVFLLMGEEIKQWLVQAQGEWRPALPRQELAYVVTEKSQLPRTIDDVLSGIDPLPPDLIDKLGGSNDPTSRLVSLFRTIAGRAANMPKGSEPTTVKDTHMYKIESIS